MHNTSIGDRELKMYMYRKTLNLLHSVYSLIIFCTTAQYCKEFVYSTTTCPTRGRWAQYLLFTVLCMLCHIENRYLGTSVYYFNTN